MNQTLLDDAILELQDRLSAILEEAITVDAQLVIAYILTVLECLELWVERHKKYGRGNIGEFGEFGCLVRDADKTARLKQFYLGNKTDFPDETVVDSWKDKVNYAIMGLMCHLDRWQTGSKDA